MARPRFDQAQFKAGGEAEEGMASSRGMGIQRHAYGASPRDQAALEGPQAPGNQLGITSGQRLMTPRKATSKASAQETGDSNVVQHGLAPDGSQNSVADSARADNNDADGG